MILISTTSNQLTNVTQIIDQVYRLNELVEISTEINDQTDILVSNEITILPDWKNIQPPVLFPIITFNENNLLGIIFTKLNNFEKAYSLLEKNQELLTIVDLLNRIQNGVAIEFSHFAEKHNEAISYHYGYFSEPVSNYTINDTYQKAVACVNDTINHAFTLKHYSIFLSDQNLLNEANEVLENALNLALPKKAVLAFKSLLCTNWIKQLNTPYNEELLQKIKVTLWECLQYYEAENQHVEVAMLYSNASFIASISKSYSEALGYSTKACNLLETENLPELLAEAQLQKANVLQTWAAAGNPQFYRPAMQCCLEALKVFTRDSAPDKFADIHLQLGTIYSEIPDEVKKKGIWASVSVSSFHEALNFYNKIDFPYEFAMISHQFAKAYTKFPVALHTDNFDKALAWYREALDIRTPKKYPLERAETLLDYLEASWYTGNKTEFDEERFNDMKTKANEVKQLTTKIELLEASNLHLQKLQELKKLQINTAII